MRMGYSWPVLFSCARNVDRDFRVQHSFARGTRIQHGRLRAAQIIALNTWLEGEKQWDWDAAHCFGCWVYLCQL
jgi:hypothetical protein